ncbi:MAG: hypothetical protein R3A52_32220 [Polyangiales bacterium]
MAQGTVRAQDPRRPPPLEEVAGCELWEGHISGNDPSAEATIQLCTEGERVTGVFLWSSLESGWDRRAFEGTWSENGRRLVMRDVRMMELHPAHGWTLCAADRYDLRLTAPGRLEGTFDSAACHDHGPLLLTLRGRTAVAPSPRPPPSEALRTHAPPDDEARPRSRLRCDATPGAHDARGVLAPLALALSLTRWRRARRSPSARSRG